MSDCNKTSCAEQFKTLIGGQALIEGIMMQGPEKRSIVVRGPEGLVTKVEPSRKRRGILTWPIIRGVYNFGGSMINGVKALMYSAEFFPEEEEESQSKTEQWIEKKFGSETLEKVLIYISVVLGICFSVGLFILLPTLISGLFSHFTDSAIILSLIEGIVRVVIFVLYMYLVSKMKDIRRVFLTTVQSTRPSAVTKHGFR